MEADVPCEVSYQCYRNKLENCAMFVFRWRRGELK